MAPKKTRKVDGLEPKVVNKVYFKTFTLTIMQVGSSQIYEIGPAKSKSN